MLSRNLTLPFDFIEEPILSEAANTVPVVEHSALWLCLYFPNLSLDVLHARQDKPESVLTEFSGRWSIHTPNKLAYELGIMSGMPLNSAYALCSELTVHQRDFKKEGLAIKEVADWACQFSSMVSVIEDYSVLIEIRGSLQLFGGLAELIDKIKISLRKKSTFIFQMSVAPTPLAARLFAESGENIIVEQVSGLRSSLGHLSICNLLLNDLKLFKKLNNIGVSCLQDLWRLPRDGLARRFGQKLVNHLDKLLGERYDPQSLHKLPLGFDASVELPFEATNDKAILIVAERMLVDLERFLRGHDSGLTQVCVRVYYYELPPEDITLNFRQNTRDAEYMLALLHERFNDIKLQASVTEVQIIVKDIYPFVAINHQLFSSQVLPSPTLSSGERNKLIDPEWDAMLEQLENRLGTKAVLQLQMVDDHRPEHAWMYGESLNSEVLVKSAKRRPVWILPKIRHLIVRNGQPCLKGPLCFLEGPERIESGWWADDDICRDYYVASDVDYSRTWIFHDLKQKNCWYLQGYF